MKTLTAVVAMMIMAATVNAGENANASNLSYFSDAAKYKCINATKVIDKYLSCLSSENEGVVESALAHVAMFKLMLPASDFKAVNVKVTEVSLKAASAETRYKAFLTKTVLEEPRMFVRIEETRYNSADELFGALASKMSETLAVR